MTKQLNTEIIAVGTELLLGQIANTNAQWMSDKLASHGINTYYHTVVGDNLNRLANIFQQAQQRSDVVLVSGGLGPTLDDLSREAFEEISGIPIVEDKDSLEKIEAYFAVQQTEMTPNNKRQARIFKDSVLLTNKRGMAPGNFVEFNGVKWFFMPGVPKEMKQIFADEIIPRLKDLNGDMVIESEALKFIGIGESILEHKLTDLITTQENPTIAPLAEKDGITVRVSAKASTKAAANEMIAETKQLLLAEIGEYYYGNNNITIEQKIIQLLNEQEKTIASAESLTGGAFAERLVAVEGVSTVFKGAVVCYDPQVKTNVLNVQNSTIEQEGTVSEQCAKELAKNVATVLNSTIGISFTGVAGPSKVEGKPVGTVYIGIHDGAYENIVKCHFQGSRNEIRQRAVLKGYELLFNYLK
ncbi:MAG TPA: competence/damage-inducible protein A [Pseudogracilibacillus sp.]|nr:competence/damage-inducible protein A [Pseudogracilibacillus sp.]